jgi:Transposase DDE domain
MYGGSVMDEILSRFVSQAPVAVMARAAMARIFSDTHLDELFGRCAATQYTRSLTFSTLFRLMTKVTLRTHESVHAAYRHTQGIPVSLTAVYDKLGGLETGISEGLVHETAKTMEAIIAALPLRHPDPIPGLRLRTLDGNCLAGTDHRLGCLRGDGAAALPGMSLVVRDDRTGLLTDMIACEDAYTSERSLFPRLLALVRPDDLWLADRNFCTDDYLSGIDEKKAYFLVRHHAGSKLESLGEERWVGSNATGDLFEQQVRIGPLKCRCIVVRLHVPLRDGTTEIRLLTNVPPSAVGAKRLAELYRTRWKIESAFQDLTDYLRCEVNTLGYPKAALFAFALALTAYNLLMVIKGALGSGQGMPRVDQELSTYHLGTELAVYAEGMAVAVPEEAWKPFEAMSIREFAHWLHRMAQRLDWKRYRKNPRKPKEPTTVRRTSRGAHRSTARVLKQKGQKG